MTGNATRINSITLDDKETTRIISNVSRPNPEEIKYMN